MKMFKHGLSAIFLSIIAVISPVVADQLDYVSVEKLQQIMALSHEKKENSEKKPHFAQQVYLKAKQIIKKPYVKKLLYGSICVAVLIMATYSSSDIVPLELPEEPEVKSPKKPKNISDKKSNKKKPSSNKKHTRRASKNKSVSQRKPIQPQSLHDENVHRSDHVIMEPDEPKDEQKVETIENQQSKIEPQNIKTDSSHQEVQVKDAQQGNKELKYQEQELKQAEQKNIEAKKARYYELRCEDDLDFDQYQEFMALRDEFTEKGLL